MSEYIRNGFKVGPNYARPPAPLADDWVKRREALQTAGASTFGLLGTPLSRAPVGAISQLYPGRLGLDADDWITSVDQRKDGDDLSQWWRVFNDPILDDLICSAYKQNLTLRQAGARILEARALLGIAVGNFFPQSQFASASYESIAQSGETAGASVFKQRNFGQWNFGFSLAWEVDFWGRFRRTIESASANLDASVEDYDDVLVTLLGDVAANYVQMRTFEKRIEYTQENVSIQAETKKTAEDRRRGDKLGDLNLEQAKALLYQTEAGIPELQIALRQTQNQLAVLLGLPPLALQTKLQELEEKHGKRSIPTANPGVALGIPADLLRRRPDIRRAERQAAAQSALIGVAQSDFYPRISLVGNLGYSAQQFKKLFNPLAFNGTVGPSAQWEVLNYGRILNNVRLQNARFQELTYAYQDRVLVAQQEVENGLVTFWNAKQRADSQSESVKAAAEAERISKDRWKANDVTFTTVSLIQQNKVQQDDTLAQAQGEIALGLIQIYRALGGGWQIRLTGCEPAVAPPVQIDPGLSDDSAPAPRPIARFGPPS
jgi:NodT family efflux transporter outer membrane factor (OMF) lipoprotein